MPDETWEATEPGVRYYSLESQMRSCINSFNYLNDRTVLLRHDFIEALRVHIDITLPLEQTEDTRRRSPFLILRPVLVPQLLLLDEATTCPR